MNSAAIPRGRVLEHPEQPVHRLRLASMPIMTSTWPSHVKTDRLEKMWEYAAAGIPWYWLVSVSHSTTV